MVVVVVVVVVAGDVGGYVPLHVQELATNVILLREWSQYYHIQVLLKKSCSHVHYGCVGNVHRGSATPKQDCITGHKVKFKIAGHSTTWICK